MIDQYLSKGGTRDSFVTKDGSTITELAHPGHDPLAQQSLALAEVAPGQKTSRHRHHRAEELYHVTHGRGRMYLAERNFLVAVGDTVIIAPGTSHCIENVGDEPLRFLCACAPAYSDEDTELS